MNSKNRTARIIGSLILIATLFVFISPDLAEARRGFGGKRSFGGSRSRSYKKTKPRTTQKKPPSSLGGKRTTRKQTPSQKAASSFGGKRLSSSKQYTSKYGTPRKKSTKTISKNGNSQRYVVNNYGGYGSGLMTGYLMGTTSWLWFTPFHPAFYYSRPYYADNPDGTVGVYPPTFSWSKVFFTLIVVGMIGYIIYALIRNKRRTKKNQTSRSSFA